MASVLLTHTDINSGTAVTVKCSGVLVSGKKNLTKEPYVNGDAPSEVHTQAVNNLKIVLQRVRFTDESGTLTWADVITLLKLKYDGTNYATLNVNYGTNIKGTDYSRDLIGLEESTDIKVLLEDFSFPIDVSTSREGYMPEATLNFIETL